MPPFPFNRVVTDQLLTMNSSRPRTQVRKMEILFMDSTSFSLMTNPVYW